MLVGLDASVGTVTLVGAGDIASCTNDNDEATARLLDEIPGTVFTLGDNAYDKGSDADYANCYDPTWGRHKARTRPAVGDREDATSGSNGFHNYFGVAGGESAKYYYSYDVGDWHIVVLNSKLSTSTTSAQYEWLEADLAANTRQCMLAYWHKPYISSASGVRESLKPIWELLYAHGVEIVLNADNRYYERFAPQTPDEVATPDGIRQFIVGTGGAGNTSVPGTRHPNSEVAQKAVPGVLKLTLEAGRYAWEFVPVAGKNFTDSGTGSCSGASPVAQPGGPYESEGTVTFDGSASFNPHDEVLTYDWNFGDGSPQGTGVTPTHTYTSDGTYTVTLVVTDALGNASEPATTTAQIHNIPPSVDVGADRSGIVGAPISLSAQVSDPNPADGPWQYTIVWGDGTPLTTGFIDDLSILITATHTFAAAGNYTVTVTVTDKDQGQGSAFFVASITAPSGAEPYLFIGAGDIGTCGTGYWNQRDEETGKLLDQYPTATVFTAGDNANPDGTTANYDCYDQAWGRHKHRTWAALGNREYNTGNAEATWEYFGDRVGPRGKGYYSFDIGDYWHVIVLNDNASFVPIKSGSEQDRWLQEDLAANTKPCTIAIFHQPMVMSSDNEFNYRSSRQILWDRLYAAGAEIILNGHQHFYERFAPMNPSRERDDAKGIRQFIVGTGGDGTKEPTQYIAPLSEVRSADYGVLKLALYPDRYEWEFLPIPGYEFTDQGSGTCH
ncbi:MAG: PKD domain-containing protein [Gemmatimonadetes bacterium]|nr:PKD domain-containing protein [Gemmatimonadota bacterium]